MQGLGVEMRMRIRGTVIKFRKFYQKTVFLSDAVWLMWYNRFALIV